MIVKDKNHETYDIPDALKTEFDAWVAQQNVPGCEPWPGTNFIRYLQSSGQIVEGSHGFDEMIERQKRGEYNAPRSI